MLSKKNTILIGILLFLDLFIIVGVVGIAVIENSTEPLVGIIFAVFISIFLYKQVRYTCVCNRYAKAMRAKEYSQAASIVDKNLSRYSVFKILQINLLLVTGQVEEYLCAVDAYHIPQFYYNRNSHWLYLYFAHKVYCDYLLGKNVSFADCESVENVDDNYAPKMLVSAIKYIQNMQFDLAEESINQYFNSLNVQTSEFAGFVFLHIKCSIMVGMGKNNVDMTKLLEKKAYNEFLANSCLRFVSNDVS